MKNEKDNISGNFLIPSQDHLNEEIGKMDMKISNMPKIEIKEVVIQGTGNFLNLKDNIINIPIEMIVFPFFTPQKQNKRINFQYSFEDLGVTMFCTLVAKDQKDKVYQPSLFEEKIYNFLISLYEAKKEVGLEEEEEYIEFEIADFIVNFLGNKMNRVYYSKVEQALKNLKSTEYQFVVSNHTKFGKYKFEDEEFKLLTYKKLKIGKKIFYRVKLNKNIRNKIKDKRYIKYNSRALMEIMNKDPIAGRIYKYISKIRYENNNGKINLRTLAAIIPLRMEQETERVSKNGEKKIYILSRAKQVLKRVLKAYEILKKLGYIEKYSFEEEKKENTYYINYIFNNDKDGECHISSFLENKNIGFSKNKKNKLTTAKLKKEIIEEVEIVDEKINSKSKSKKIETYSDLPEKLVLFIHKAKRNIYVQRSWDKRTDTKIRKIYREDGENLAIEVLKVLYKNLNKNIKTTLVQYINGILKNMYKTNNGQKQNLTLFNNDVKEKVMISKKKIKQARKGIKKSLTNTIKELKEEVEIPRDILIEFDKFDEYEKLKIEEEALKLCSEDTGTEESFLFVLKNNSKMIYLNTIKKYIGQVLDKR
ncbi:chromosomal replication initiator DnaA [Fusobacterium sp. MFO224]|uniref:chromosomal replication initiator DnaA n=1 Tax=Fusobacterium sp. MFO224 TaxID=3378070 RepID=UPI0038537902